MPELRVGNRLNPHQEVDVNCPNCGGATAQGPNGGWYCPNCGWSSGVSPEPTAVACAHDHADAT